MVGAMHAQPPDSWQRAAVALAGPPPQSGGAGDGRLGALPNGLREDNREDGGPWPDQDELTAVGGGQRFGKRKA